MRAVATLALLFCFVTGVLPQARAQGRSAAEVGKAKAHFERGQRLFNVSRYREALEEFKEAFLAVEEPVFLFNIAQSHRLLGEREEAKRFYRRYLDTNPAPAERARAEKWLAELEAASAPARVAPAPPPSPTRVAQAAPPAATAPAVTVETQATPIHKRWWFWAGLGAAVLAGGIAGALALDRGDRLTCGTEVPFCTQL